MAKNNYNNRKPGAICTPTSRQPRVGQEPHNEATDQLSPAWQFHRCDEDHHLWGWTKLKDDERLGVIKSLHDFETMTWIKIKQAAGGRSNGTNSHSLPISGFSKEAKKRLEELKLDDNDELFSLRLNNTARLYGVRDGRVLRFVWYDQHHGTPNGAYPTKSR